MDEDADGRADPVDTHFTYDGNQIILEFDDNGSLTNRYLWEFRGHEPILTLWARLCAFMGCLD